MVYVVLVIAPVQHAQDQLIINALHVLLIIAQSTEYVCILVLVPLHVKPAQGQMLINVSPALLLTPT